MHVKSAIQLCATCLLLSAFPAHAQGSLPSFPAKTYYGDARAKLQSQGYAPVTTKRAPGQCEEENLGREEVCKKWPEVESCAGTGFARCTFLWRRDKMTVEVRTVGDERELVDRVRCRSGCR